MNQKKIKTLQVIEKELHKRLKRMKTSTINIKIALSNNDIKALGTVADDYTRALDENMRMLLTMEKLLNELEEEN